MSRQRPPSRATDQVAPNPLSEPLRPYSGYSGVSTRRREDGWERPNSPDNGSYLGADRTYDWDQSVEEVYEESQERIPEDDVVGSACVKNLSPVTKPYWKLSASEVARERYQRVLSDVSVETKSERKVASYRELTRSLRKMNGPFGKELELLDNAILFALEKKRKQAKEAFTLAGKRPPTLPQWNRENDLDLAYRSYSFEGIIRFCYR
ncbi:hypothetical protein K523DRAFT_422408 [Schizophyllum commune Tattone D]|nr:hypothetical protein K523DRAFT_422408 [Schizophyllum commune Tattone D]